MILLSVKAFMQTHQQASASQVARQFDIPVNVASGLLEQLMKHAYVKKHVPSPGCGRACDKCTPALDDLYLWCDEKVASAAIGK